MASYVVQGNWTGFNKPNSVAVHLNEVYVADAGNFHVEVRDLQGMHLRTLGDGYFPHPSQPGQLPGGPGGIAVWGNRAYVTDLGGNVVHVFDRQQGTPLQPRPGMPPNPWPGGPNSPFHTPGRIAIDGDEVYVTDSQNHRVQVFDLQGRFKRLWGCHSSTVPPEPGYFDRPAGIFALGVFSKEVYVSDRSNNRIQVFNRCGAFLRMWGSKDDPQFLNEPVGIFVHSRYNEVYVADLNNNRVRVFDRYGTHLRDFPDPVTADRAAPGQFNHPNAVAVYRQRNSSGRVVDTVYVTDRDNDQVQIWDRI
jgi:DNA-binding beta-propeller fold protein YncE